MAKSTPNIRNIHQNKRKKLGKHSKKKHSNNKNSKNYKKRYNGQGR